MLTHKVWSFQLIDPLGQEFFQGFPTGNQPKLQDQPQGIPLKRNSIPIQQKKSSLRAQRSLPAQQTSQKSRRTQQTNYSRRCLIGGTSETRLTKPTRRGDQRKLDRQGEEVRMLKGVTVGNERMAFKAGKQNRLALPNNWSEESNLSSSSLKQE